MIDQLNKIKASFATLEKELSSPEVLQDHKQYTALQKKYKDLSKVVAQIVRYEENQVEHAKNRSLLETEKDTELLELAKEERDELTKETEEIEKTLKIMLLPQDPNDEKNIVLELRAGTGGDEAALWVGDLFKMYQRFAERKNWKVEMVSSIVGTSGGYKEIICHISGKKVYSLLKYESGVHRVQRIPSTESQGRIHTSAAAVVVLPEVDDIETDVNMSEVRKDFFCSSGPGGQSVNTTYSAVRLTHLPTGITVSCQDGKSQIKNMEKAQKILAIRIYEEALKQQQATVGEKRKSMIGSGDRSAKIRTYNYPRAFVNDHRIHYTQHNLPQFLNGHLDELINALSVADNTAKLAQV